MVCRLPHTLSHPSFSSPRMPIYRKKTYQALLTLFTESQLSKTEKGSIGFLSSVTPSSALDPADADAEGGYQAGYSKLVASESGLEGVDALWWVHGEGKEFSDGALGIFLGRPGMSWVGELVRGAN